MDIKEKDFSKRIESLYRWLGKKETPKAALIRTLCDLNTSVEDVGGWIQATGLKRWNRISESLNLEDSKSLYFSNNLHLLHLESSELSPSEALSLDPSMISDAPVYQSDFDWELILSEDIAVVQLPSSFPLDMFSTSNLIQKHGQERIKILMQSRSSTSFKATRAYKIQSTVSEYVQIMNNPPPDPDEIPFVTNIDINHWLEDVEKLKTHVPAEVVWEGSSDALKHARQDYIGINTPQLYLKIEGCWTGGHEENLRFAAANINHGPGDVEWWGLDSSQALAFREKVKQDFGFDIYLKETLWWPDHLYCMKNGFEVKYLIQKKGDLVIVGPGTIHWVKSLGVTANSAWNFAPMKLKNFRKSFERDDFNLAIKFRSIVPIYTLSLDLLNHDMSNLNPDLKLYLLKKIQKKCRREKKHLRGPAEVNNIDNVLCCETCFVEVLRFYVVCKDCYAKRARGSYADCFFCFNCHLNHRCSNFQVIEKFTDSDLSTLISRANGQSTDSVQNQLVYTKLRNIAPELEKIEEEKEELPLKRTRGTSLIDKTIEDYKIVTKFKRIPKKK